MEPVSDVVISILNPTILDSITKGKPFNLILQAKDVETGQPLASRRIRFEFILANGNTEIPSGVVEEDKYIQQITDSKGCRTCRLVTEELSRSWEGDLFHLIVRSPGSTQETKSQGFKVVSKRKKNPDRLAQPMAKNRKTMDIIEDLERRVKKLEEALAQ